MRADTLARICLLDDRKRMYTIFIALPTVMVDIIKLF